MYLCMQSKYNAVMNIIILSLILLAVFFNTVAQLALKTGMSQIGHFTFHCANFTPIIWKAVTCPWIILGTATYVGSMMVWLMVLSRSSVGIAYPMSSLGYVTSAIAAYYFLGEDLSMIRLTGIFVILVGVYIVAKS